MQLTRTTEKSQMTRRAFFSFHFDRDAWRAGQVRNIGAVDGNEPVSDNSWEDLKKKGDKAIQRWIDSQMDGCSCVIVLVGQETAGREWIDYEIKKAWDDGRGLLGIRVHRLENEKESQDREGANPFDRFRVNGTPLSQHVSLHDPSRVASKDTYAVIRRDLADWVEAAIAARQRR